MAAFMSAIDLLLAECGQMEEPEYEFPFREENFPGFEIVRNDRECIAIAFKKLFEEGEFISVDEGSVALLASPRLSIIGTKAQRRLRRALQGLKIVYVRFNKCGLIREKWRAKRVIPDLIEYAWEMEQAKRKVKSPVSIWECILSCVSYSSPSPARLCSNSAVPCTARTIFCRALPPADNLCSCI